MLLSTANTVHFLIEINYLAFSLLEGLVDFLPLLFSVSANINRDCPVQPYSPLLSPGRKCTRIIMKKLNVAYLNNLKGPLLVLNGFMNPHTFYIGTCPERRLAVMPPKILAVIEDALATKCLR